MEEFISKLNEEQISYLKEIKPEFWKMETQDLDEFLTNLFQENGLEDIENDPKQLLLESILDILGTI